jgi:ankyrin repeat protein
VFVENLESVSNDSSYDIQERGRACLQLCWAYIDSFGVAQDNDTALDWAVKAARLDFYPAQGLVKRLFDVFQKPIGPGLQGEILVWMTKAAGKRHSVARDDLRKFDYSLAQTADENWKRSLGCQSTNPKQPYFFDEISAQFDPHDLDARDKAFGKEGESLWWLSPMHNTLLHAGSAAAVDLFNFEAYLKKYNLDINARDVLGNTPLLIAMMCGNENHAQVLLRFGADASIANEDGETPCHWLITLENSARINHLLSQLLQQGADLAALAVESISFQHEYSARKGGTPLHWAVQSNNTELVEKLLAHGADPEVAYDGYTPIDIAVQRNLPSVLGKLLGAAQRPVRSSQVATTITDFRTPGFVKKAYTENYVNLAVGGHSLHERLVFLGRDRLARLRETIEVLQAEGLAIKTKTSPTSIAAAFSSADTKTIETLMDIGYPTQLEDIGTFWEDALIAVIYESHPAVQQFLLKQAIHKSPDRTLSRPEEILLKSVKSLHTDASVVQQILDTGIDINYKDENGKSALVIAVDCRNYDVATHLLSKGADVNILQPKEKESSDRELSVNILYYHILTNTDLALEPLKYLLQPLHPYHDQIPCSMVISCCRQTALQLACVSGNRLVFKFLLQTFNEKVHLNFRDKKGNTALHAAVYWGRFDFAKALHEAGADIDPPKSNIIGLNHKTLMDVCFMSSTLTQTSFHGGKSGKEEREECLVNRLHIWRYLKQCGAQRSQHKLLSMDLHMKFACVAVLEGMMNLLKSCLSRVEFLFPIRQQFLDSLLFLASRFRQTASMRFLLIRGADLKARSKTGRTVLHYAVLRGDVEGAQLLLLQGADINVLDIHGWNPTSLAHVTGQLGVYKLLKESGGVLLFPKPSLKRRSSKSRMENSPEDERLTSLDMLDYGDSEIETDWEDIDDDDMSDPTVAGAAESEDAAQAVDQQEDGVVMATISPEVEEVGEIKRSESEADLTSDPSESECSDSEDEDME